MSSVWWGQGIEEPGEIQGPASDETVWKRPMALDVAFSRMSLGGEFAISSIWVSYKASFSSYSSYMR